MTRFARGAGSKAANARAPEQATPWNELRTQLQQAQAAKEDAEKEAQFEAKRKENYENFLKEHKESKIKQVWCEFEDQPSSKKAENPGNVVLKKNKRKKMEMAKLKAEKDGILNNSEINAEGDSSKKKETAKQFKPPEGSDEEMDADNEELTTWLNENSDTEIQEEYDDLTSQLESILKKNEESLGKKNKNLDDSEDKKSDKKKKKKEKNLELTSNTVDDTLELAVDESISEKKSKNKKNKKESSNDCEENNEFDQPDESKKLKKKNKKCIAETVEDVDPIQMDIVQDSVPELDDSNKPTKKRKKNRSTSENIINESTNNNAQVENNNLPLEKDKKNKKRKISECNNVDDNKPADNCDIDKDIKNKKRKTQTKLQEPNSSDNVSQIKNKVDGSNKNNENNKKNKKDKNAEYARRKPLNENKTILIVNGEEVEVTTFGGFPILSKDAERLQQLRKSLVSKGIPRSEVDRTMKLERRRAEKSLSRIKKKLCFHCRKGGHNLSECPELNQKSETTGVPSSGICFKCGSTEHTHFACRVVKTQDFKFASCFICNEQGHISRQCPDNPRGLYPKGGGCRECGDVTHLKKDCPKILQLREDHTMKLDTIESNNIEDISRKQSLAKDSASKIKHVKF